jgi:hypothetical protein
MIEPRLFLCSGAAAKHDDVIAKGRRTILLDSIGSKANVNIRFENVAKILQSHLSPRLTDLLEIAAYVYTADCSTQRGTRWTDDDSTEPWERDFAFVIPVREPKFWISVSSQLTELLHFLSNDRYSFQFVPLTQERFGQQEYLEFGGKDDWPFLNPERVIMFSGGLDSLAGVVESARKGGKLVLVSHRPVTTLSARQKVLFSKLQRKFPHQLVHVPVWINKSENFSREPTQRTRSFLYAALGTVVGASMRAGGVRFFENGVVSLNLPVAGEVIRSRASRTTHPVALHLLGELCTAVSGSDFAIDNPYLYKTKKDVVESLKIHRAEHLIGHTCSCAHMMFKAKSQQHCGSCSQCIDRRFAIVGAGLQAQDPETDYEIDVFTGPREDGPEKSMAVDYTRHALELSQRTEGELAARFNMELSRAARYEPKRSEAVGQLLAMHKRHGETIFAVLKEVLKEQAEPLLQGKVDKTSLLALALNGERIVRESPTTSIEEQLRALVDKLAGSKDRTEKKTKLQKRDSVIFAAILLEHHATSYCEFLHSQKVRPKWANGNSSNGSYPASYQSGNPWRKKVQDEKTRAKTRMNRYTESELAKAFQTFLPRHEDDLRQKLSLWKPQSITRPRTTNLPKG